MALNLSSALRQWADQCKFLESILQAIKQQSVVFARRNMTNPKFPVGWHRKCRELWEKVKIRTGADAFTAIRCEVLQDMYNNPKSSIVKAFRRLHDVDGDLQTVTSLHLLWEASGEECDLNFKHRFHKEKTEVERDFFDAYRSFRGLKQWDMEKQNSVLPNALNGRDVSSKGFLSRYLATESGLFDIDIPMITPGHTPTKASFDIDAGQVAGRLSSLTLVTPSNLSRKRILSLDGSGTWAFAELFFLREILRQLCSELSEEEKQKYKLGRHPDDLQPHKFFDLIIGSSTGGLLALMFGSLKMSVNQAIAAFRYLCEKAFAPDVVKASAAFSSRFEASFKELISKAGVSKDQLFCPVHGGCRVAVTAAYESSITDLKVFRSHEIWDEVKLWEVARATIAMPRLFLPITIDDTEYVDASGTGHLNPIMAAVNEAHSIWRDDDFKYGCVISLGGGERPPVQRNPNLSADALLEAVVDAGQHGSREATQADNYFCDSDFYFRFEAKRPAYTHAVEDFDPEKLREAAGLAKAELNKPRRQKEIERAGQRLWTLSKQNGVEL